MDAGAHHASRCGGSPSRSRPGRASACRSFRERWMDHCVGWHQGFGQAPPQHGDEYLLSTKRPSASGLRKPKDSPLDSRARTFLRPSQVHIPQTASFAYLKSHLWTEIQADIVPMCEAIWAAVRPVGLIVRSAAGATDPAAEQARISGGGRRAAAGSCGLLVARSAVPWGTESSPEGTPYQIHGMAAGRAGCRQPLRYLPSYALLCETR